MVVELCKSFTNYGSNKYRSCNWVVSHLRITDFYDFYDETNNPLYKKIFKLTCINTEHIDNKTCEKEILANFLFLKIEVFLFFRKARRLSS